MKPFFSIIVPTLNRALTLKHCLRTIESQKFTDYEVIVSDNCSDDNTAEVTLEAQKTNPRIKYVRPEIQLPMSAHWEFAFEYATGSYVSFLGDDDGVTPSGLDVAHQILIAHGMPTALNSVNVEYHWPNSPVKFHESLIRVPIGEYWVQERDSRLMLNMLKKHTRLYIELPMVYRGFVRKDVLHSIQQRTGRLIRSPIPDVYSACAIAAVTSTYLFTNQSLFIEGVSGQSNGAATLLGAVKNDKSFFRDDGIPFHSRLGYSPTTAFLHAESLLQCFDSSLLGEELLMTPEDLISHAAELSINLPPERYQQSWEAINLLSEQNGLEKLNHSLRIKYPNQPIQKSPFPDSKFWIDSRNTYEPSLAFRGDEMGITTVWDCAQMLKGFHGEKSDFCISMDLANSLLLEVRKSKQQDLVEQYLKHRERSALSNMISANHKLTETQNQLAKIEFSLAESMSRLILIEERRKRLMQLLKQYHRGAKQAARNLKKSSFELFGSSRWKLGGLLTRPFSKKGKEPHTGLVNASKALEKTIRRLNEIDLSTLSGDSNSNGGVIIPCSSNLPDTKPD